jgi:hypothetical protein
VLTHHLFGPDEIIEVPRAGILGVSLPTRRHRITIECVDGTIVEVSPFSWAEVIAASIRLPVPRADASAAQHIYERLIAE